MSQGCFYVDETMYTPNGFVPAWVEENEPGYSPLIGNGEFAQPWFWGKDIATAKQLCEKANAERGISPERASEIVSSSIRAGIVKDARSAEVQERWDRIREGR